MGKNKKDFDLDRIDKLLAQFPDEDSPPKPEDQQQKGAQPPGQPIKRRISQTVADAIRHRSPVFAWASVVAGVVLAVAMTQWPYAYACGTGLGMYLLAALGVMIVGIWAGVNTWKARLAVPHVLALGVFFWGVGLGLFQVLPRIGYARTEATWRCWGQPQEPTADVPVAAPTPVPAPAPAAGAPVDSALVDSAAAAGSMAVDSVPGADSVPRGDTAATGDSVPVQAERRPRPQIPQRGRR